MTKIVLSLYILIFGLSAIFGQATTNCRELANKGIEILNEKSYIPDGRFNSTLLKQNDITQVYKPFIHGKKYMIVINTDDTLPGFEVTLSDMTRKIIYKKNTSENKLAFEYTPDKSQNLIISVKVNSSEDLGPDIRGCVNIIIGSIRLPKSD